MTLWVAKLIVHQPTREETIMSAIRALEEFVVLGIDTTIPFHIRLLNNDIFRSGEFNTKFLEEHNIMDTDESN
jgi:acetyl-CoA carboxylase biotin carboxylase subunit